jgi:hypothetical protein
MNLFRTYLVQTGEKTEIENLSAEALNEKFSTFLLSVRKKYGSEHEPTTLGGFLCSLGRYLRQKNSNLNVNSGPQLAKCREVLKAKTDRHDDIEKVKWRKFTRARGECTPKKATVKQFVDILVRELVGRVRFISIS